MRLTAVFLMLFMLCACQASGTAGSSGGANANFFANILTLRF